MENGLYKVEFQTHRAVTAPVPASWRSNLPSRIFARPPRLQSSAPVNLPEGAGPGDVGVDAGQGVPAVEA